MSRKCKMSLFACDIDELKSATGTVKKNTRNDDGSFSCIFTFPTELRIPIVPTDEFRVRRTPEAMRIYVNLEGAWVVAGHVAMETWPVPGTARPTVTCVLPDPVCPKMQATWQ